MTRQAASAADDVIMPMANCLWSAMWRSQRAMATRALASASSTLAPVPAVLILTTYDHDADIVRAVEAGAAGYLLKDVGIDELTAAVLAAAAGELRLTFDGFNSGWTSHADLLRPLHDDKQIFIANHTWSHHDLLRLSPAEVADQVRRKEAFLHKTHGTLGRPFMRAPYRSHEHALDARLADLGYPAVTMWLGDLGDSTVRKPQAIVASVKQWLLPGHIVIGHANHLPVTKVYGQLVEIIRALAVQPVHRGDVFAV
jgi:hypothetical protein